MKLTCLTQINFDVLARLSRTRSDSAMRATLGPCIVDDNQQFDLGGYIGFVKEDHSLLLNAEEPCETLS